MQLDLLDHRCVQQSNPANTYYLLIISASRIFYRSPVSLSQTKKKLFKIPTFDIFSADVDLIAPPKTAENTFGASALRTSAIVSEATI